MTVKVVKHDCDNLLINDCNEPGFARDRFMHKT